MLLTLSSILQRETEKVIALRAKKESLAADAENSKTMVEGITKGIADTRMGVTDVKSFIDGMRSSRDTKMADLNALKAQLKEQNQRLLQVTQVWKDLALSHLSLSSSFRTRQDSRPKTRSTS